MKQMPALSTRDARSAGVGLAIILVVWLGTSGIPRLLQAHRALRARVDAHLSDLARARQIVAEAPASKDSFAAAARVLVQMAPRLIDGRTTSEAAASLISLLSTVATRDRVRIGRTEVIQDSSPTPFARVTVRVEAQGDIEGLARWLGSIEEGTPSIGIQDLALTAVDPNSPSERAEVLRAELVAVGWATLKSEARP